MSETLRSGIKLCFIENYEQNKSIIENMICCVCLNVIIKPFECTLCETFICEECLQIIQIAGKKCVLTKCKGNYRKANKFVREVLSTLKITCEFCSKGNLSYQEYVNHLDKCYHYESSTEIQLLKQIKEKEDKIAELQKEFDNKKTTSTPNKLKDPYSSMSKEGLRAALISFNLPINQKMELYNSCVEGRLEEFKNLVVSKKYPMLEEVSAHNYYWTPLHYAMHYGQIEIIKFFDRTA